MQNLINKQVIVVAQSGFVYMGTLVEDSASTVTLHDAHNVRVWGTSKGLGQLALSGPTSATKLDPCGSVYFKPHAVLHIIPCVFAE